MTTPATPILESVLALNEHLATITDPAMRAAVANHCARFGNPFAEYDEA